MNLDVETFGIFLMHRTYNHNDFHSNDVVITDIWKISAIYS